MGLYLGGDEVSQKISTVTIGSTLPDQTDNAGKFLTTDGENVSWQDVETKQDILVSGTNIKTINDESILGSGNVEISDLNKNITNCITEIPQDIKLELNDGELTLKAGSKVYVPNGKNADGSLKFDEVMIDSDKVLTSPWGNAGKMIIYFDYLNQSITMAEVGRDTSGTTSPTQTNTQVWYDIATNYIKIYRNATDTGVRYSLPISICTKSSTEDNAQISSIDQVFNGFGYIGSTVYALPGVKGLIPNGRNEDGTLKNREFMTNSVLTTLATSNVVVGVRENAIGVSGNYSFDEINNQNNNSGSFWNVVTVGDVIISSNRVTSFKPKLPFKAVDQNELKDKFVSKTGDEEINGFKHFLDNIEVRGENEPYILLHTPNKFYGRLCMTESGMASKKGDGSALQHFYAGASDSVNTVITTAGISKSANGYVKLGNGLIIQWGNTASTATVILPTAFTTTDYVVTASSRITGAQTHGWAQIKDRTTTTFYLEFHGYENGHHYNSTTLSCSWMAIGF